MKIDRYFEAATNVMEWNLKRLPQRFRTVQYRHTLEGWSRMFEEAGLFIARLREPRPTAEALARCPALADAARVPYFLIFDTLSAWFRASGLSLDVIGFFSLVTLVSTFNSKYERPTAGRWASFTWAITKVEGDE